MTSTEDIKQIISCISCVFSFEMCILVSSCLDVRLVMFVKSLSYGASYSNVQNSLMKKSVFLSLI